MGILPIAVMLVLFGVLIAACSSDSDDGGSDGDGADATEPANGGDGDATEPADDGDGDGGGDGGSPGSGNATLTIGDESWSFDDVVCAFSLEQTFIRKQSFTLSAFGETAEGVGIELTVAILDEQEDGRYERDGVSYGILLDDVDNSENPTLAWVSQAGLFGEVEPVILVDGKDVTSDTTFVDHVIITGEEIPGTLRATCP